MVNRGTLFYAFYSRKRRDIKTARNEFDGDVIRSKTDKEKRHPLGVP
jgi:hypothetical protein